MPGGRPKGRQNKFTRTVKDVFKSVFEDLQKDEDKPWALKNWAKENPSDFYKLANKMVPQGVEVAGEGGGPAQFVVTLPPLDADS